MTRETSPGGLVAERMGATVSTAVTVLALRIACVGVKRIVDRIFGQLRARPSGSLAVRPYSTISTRPAAPSTQTIWPSRSWVVADPVPTTAGMPYSRATIAGCDNTPP